MGFLKQIVLVGFFAWLVVRIIMVNRMMRTAGFGIPVFNHAPGPCKIFYVNGSEDIDILPNGLVIFSSGLRYVLNPKGVDPEMFNRKGILYVFDPIKPEEYPRPLSLENFDESNLVPHGIDVYTDPKTEEVTLFVVNHGGGRHSVEIFHVDQENMVLKHRKTVVDELMYSPNDVVAVGPDCFYATNDRYFLNAILGLVEAFYPLKLSSVVFYDGSHVKVIVKHFYSPNGINVDPSGKFVFVVSCMGGSIVVYERSDKNDLIERQQIELGVAVDNVNVDKNGDLWLGVANAAILEYSTNFSKPLPGKALHVKLSKGENGKVPYKVDDVREVFSSSGIGDFKGASVALHYRGKLLVGNPSSNLMYCEMVVS